jgi:hypothetical protein
LSTLLVEDFTLTPSPGAAPATDVPLTLALLVSWRKTRCSPLIPPARQEFFWRRHASWDERFGLYPIVRVDNNVGA